MEKKKEVIIARQTVVSSNRVVTCSAAVCNARTCNNNAWMHEYCKWWKRTTYQTRYNRPVVARRRNYASPCHTTAKECLGTWSEWRYTPRYIECNSRGVVERVCGEKGDDLCWELSYSTWNTLIYRWMGRVDWLLLKRIVRNVSGKSFVTVIGITE